MDRRAYFRALFKRLLNIFVMASLSTTASIGSSGISRVSSLFFLDIVGSKRATVSRSSAVISTYSKVISNLWAPIFWKSRSCPVNASNRLVFCVITDRFFWIFGSAIFISCSVSNGPLIKVSGVRTSWAISVKKLTLDSYSSFSFSISNSFWRSSISFSFRCLYQKNQDTTMQTSQIK